MQRTFSLISLGLLLSLSACGGGGGNNSTPNPPNPPPAQTGAYVVTAWSELGMHCIDGKDYSVFSVLPPYNTLHAQLLKRGDPPALVTSGVTVTYEAVADPTGSINTSSSSKTNFWSHVQALFGINAAPDIGLTGTPVQSATPHPMAYNTSLGYWEAVGIPTIPVDDGGKWNPYPRVKIVAKDGSGNVLATNTAVLAVSDEMSCSTCHASGSDADAQPAAGWENDPDPAKDVKLNTLKKHDDRWDISGYLSALKAKGYNYQSSLYQTAKSGTPILCASCHATNALGANGLPGVNPLTADMHTLHGPLVNPATSLTLDNATNPAGSCYLCHPGPQTTCQRGAMNKTACFDCHGNLTKVGAATRQGWLDLPSCQMCHSQGNRFTTTFDSTGAWRVTTDSTFATNPNKPTSGKNLFRYSSGHGGLYCSACHGSQHAEYPSLKANDNLYSQTLQGYAGKLVECSICHVSAPTAASGGPHGMHGIDQGWINAHQHAADNGGSSACAYCHGSDFRGSPLSAVSTNRSFNAGDYGTKSFTAGHKVSCYDCHNGPNGG
jgi:hypothetical protein